MSLLGRVIREIETLEQPTSIALTAEPCAEIGQLLQHRDRGDLHVATAQDVEVEDNQVVAHLWLPLDHAAPVRPTGWRFAGDLRGPLRRVRISDQRWS